MLSKGTTSPDSSKEAVDILNSILEASSQRQISEPQILLILDALAGAQDPALVLRFPAVLALCARRDIELNSQKLLGRYWESSAKRQNLEKLLFYQRRAVPAVGGICSARASANHREPENSACGAGIGA